MFRYALERILNTFFSLVPTLCPLFLFSVFKADLDIIWFYPYGYPYISTILKMLDHYDATVALKVNKDFLLSPFMQPILYFSLNFL